MTAATYPVAAFLLTRMYTWRTGPQEINRTTVFKYSSSQFSHNSSLPTLGSSRVIVNL